MGIGFRKCSFSRPRRLVTDQAGVLEDLQMLHDADARHRVVRRQGTERLPVLLEQAIEEIAPGRVGEGPKDVVHRPSIGN